MDKKYGQIAGFVHFLIKASYQGKQNLNFIDLTCGNGHDTLFLSNLAGIDGFVTAFDIQAEAIERAKLLMQENGKYKNYKIIHDGHENIEHYLKETVDAAIFNLGYLPKSNKEIFTRPETTINSINSLIPLLKNSGRIYIAAYIAHDNGYEIAKVSDYLKHLNKKQYNAVHINLINKENTPPEIFIIEKNF